MATTNFNNIILAVARKLKDSRTSAAASDDSGKRYTSAILSEYVNRAVRDFLIEYMQKNGSRAFSENFTDYIRTGSSIVLSSGVGAKPSDCLTIIDLRGVSKKYEKIPQAVVSDVLAGVDGLIVPTTVYPYFYEEGQNFYTLGVTADTVVPRYIKTHQDIVVSVVSYVAGGKISTSSLSATYTAATRTVASITMSSAFVSGDIGKNVVLVEEDGGGGFVASYYGYISAVNSGTSIVLSGDGLPAADLSASHIMSLVVTSKEPSDLTLNAYWHGEIINRAVEYAVQDAKSFIQ